MGNICAKIMDQEPSRNKSKKPDKIKTQFADSQAERIHEIKEFLTLTTQNTTTLQPIDHKYSVMTFDQLGRHKSIGDFKVVRGLGRGAFGQVFMVRDTIESKMIGQADRCYAMKIILKQAINSVEQRINTISERLILEAMNHPFIVKLHYAFQSDRKLYLLCDLMLGGELFYLLRRNRKFPEEAAKFYAAQILLALEYLHSRNIIYRDLKPENILLDQDGHIKLTDFGLSKVCLQEKQVTFSICGTPEYIAPQVMLGKGYTQTADWFSFGSLLYDMLTGKPPFYSANKTQILKNITTKPVPIPEDLSPDARSLLKGLFKIKPSERLGSKGAAEIKKHPFFANVTFDQVFQKRIDAPISFKETINQEGFDIDFQGSQTTFNIDQTMKDKGLVFDGFTYYKPQLSLHNKEGRNNSQQLSRFIEQKDNP